MTTTVTKKYQGLKEGEKVPLYFDECMKIMFGNNDRLEPLTLLLSLVLEVRYESLEGKIEVVPNNIPNKELGKKKTERDIVVKIDSDDNKNVVLEVNVSSKAYKTIINRNLFYMNKVFTSRLKDGEYYDNIPITYLINFNNFYVDNENKNIFDTYYFQNSNGHILTDKQKIININIEKCYQIWYSKDEIEFRSPYEKNLFYLCSAMVTDSVEEYKECISKIDTKEVIKDILEKVSSEMNNKEDVIFTYDEYLEDERRIREGIIREEREEAKNEGIKEGTVQTKSEMIMNMYNKKLPIDTIAECANLTCEEVKKIICDCK